MYLWRKRAGPSWLKTHQRALRSRAGDRLTIIERPNRRRLQIEVATSSRRAANTLAKRFGGRVEELRRDWLKRSLRRQKTKPLKVRDRRLTIPAGRAFGTGEHATTAMCLRLLEQLMDTGRDGSPSRPSKSSDASEKRPYRLVVDLGTGSGILALAARSLGAKRVIAIDVDPLAVATARQNARLNKIDNVQFRVADVRRWKLPPKIDIVTANFFSDLLVEILPKLERVPWLILSGIMREQEPDLTRAFRRHKIDIVQARRRGKWVTLLANGGGT